MVSLLAGIPPTRVCEEAIRWLDIRHRIRVAATRHLTSSILLFLDRRKILILDRTSISRKPIIRSRSVVPRGLMIPVRVCNAILIGCIEYADILLGNYYYDRINSDKLAPPGTDHGQTINAQWPMGKSGLCREMYNLLTVC